MSQEELLLEKKELEEIKKKCEDMLEKSIEGKLRICRDKDRIKYYHREKPNESKGKLLKKSEFKVAVNLAEKDYYSRLNKLILSKLDMINLCLEKYPFETLDTVYSGLNAYRKQLVNPMIISDEEYVRQWSSEKYEGRPFYSSDASFITKENEHVRSKSELIIADRLHYMGVPYKYECPLYIKGMGNIYPDFTILNIKNREEIYLEHFGMMDNPEYIKTFLKKQSTYINNGIIPGKNLFMTFESGDYPLNIKELEKILVEMLK